MLIRTCLAITAVALLNLHEKPAAPNPVKSVVQTISIETPLPPTPEPATPAPEPVRTVHATNPPVQLVGRESTAEIIRSIFPETAWAAAFKVVECESRFNQGAVGSAGEVSIWQIHPIHRARIRKMGFTWGQTRTDVTVATRVAYSIWAEQGWRPWTCRKAI